MPEVNLVVSHFVFIVSGVFCPWKIEIIMKCVIPNQNVKIIARAVHSLAKLGDEMYIEPSRNEIAFRTVNMAQSAFVEFKMNESFFSAFLFSDPEDDESLSKVTMRSCINVFKNLNNLDKQVESCEIKMKPDATVVIFLMKFNNAPIKKYYLPVIESEKLEANIPTEPLNQLTAPSKMLMSTIKNFRFTEDEITIRAEKDKTYIRNHIELKKDMQSMRTELCFHPSEFETYSVSNPVNVTFCLKELRAVLSFAEPSNLSVSLSFSSPGMPILFQVTNFPAYEANYVVSTLNASTSSLEMNITRQRSVGQPLQQQAVNTPQELCTNATNVIDETESFTTHQNSLSQNLPSQNNAVNIVSEVSVAQVEQIICLDEHSKNGKNKVSPNKNNTSLSDCIESIYAFQSNSLQNLYTEKTNCLTSTCENMYKDKPSEFIKIIFARCFRRDCTHEKLPANEIVLADASDQEST